MLISTLVATRKKFE